MLPVVESPRWTSLATARKTYARIPEVHPIPNLIDLQLDSFTWFVEKGLRELFEEISPIQDFTGRVMELHFGKHEFGEPKYTQLECRARDLTFARPLYVDVELRIKETGEIQSQRVYMGDFPFMTDQGTFIINGAERVVVSQLVRSPGVYYTKTEDPSTGRNLFSAKVIPNRGAWLEFETTAKQNVLQLWVKVDRKRKLEATKLLRAVGYEQNEVMLELFRTIDTTSRRRSPRRSRRTPPPRAVRPSSRSTRSCARATRPPATTPRSSSRASSSTSAATTWAVWAATSSTRSWTRSPRAWASSCRATSGPSPRKTSPPSSASSSSSTTGWASRTTSTTWATAASAPTAS